MRRGRHAGAWIILAALNLVGCMGWDDAAVSDRSVAPNRPPDRVSLEEPCPDGATLRLGAPFRGRDYAKFQTAGGTVYVTIRHVGIGGADDAEAGESTVYVGAMARPPTYDPHSGRVRGTTATTSVVADTWSAIDLTEGRYWLTVSNGWDVAIRSCEPRGVLDAAGRVDDPASDSSATR